jgi:uncharacterized damage-inducible protein DinB
MSDLSWNQLLLDQLEWHWTHQLRPRLEGLTDDELRWEPGGDVTTIKWRLDHIILALADRSAKHLGRDPVSEDTYRFSPTAGGTLALLDQEYTTWVAGVRALGDDGPLLPCGPAEGSWRASPRAAVVTHIHKEVIHHGAEVALLRDLYAIRSSLRGAKLVNRDLRDARFVNSGLSGVVMRGVDVQGMQIDAPWLLEGDGGSLRVNDVEVAPLVDAELDRRFPGRSQRRASDPAGLRAAWDVLQRTWATTLARVDAMPPGTSEVSVDGEWSLAQTLRHLVLATDMWLGLAVLERSQPFHPLGLADHSLEPEGFDMSVFATDPPSYAEVLAARADRVALVSDFLASVTAEELNVAHPNPHDPAHKETTLACLHVILEEEWEHHRFAVRDLDAIAQMNGPSS